MTREEAKQALLQGKKLTHEFYADDEYLFMKDGVLTTEDGYTHGGFQDEFWTQFQTYPIGWYLKEE